MPHENGLVPLLGIIMRAQAGDTEQRRADESAEGPRLGDPLLEPIQGQLAFVGKGRGERFEILSQPFEADVAQ